MAKLRAGALWVSNETAPASDEPLATPKIDVHSGLPMAAALDVLRHLWFRGPDSLAPAHVAVWRHLDSIADTIKYLQKHTSTPQLKIVIYAAIASGHVRTSRDAVPDDKVLLKLCHGSAEIARDEGLRTYRDGWEWSPYMPKPEGSDKTPTASRYGVPVAVPVAEWDEPMWVVRIVHTVTEGELVSMRITVGFEHPHGSIFYEEEFFWRIMRVAGLDPAEWFMKHQPNDFGGTMYKKPVVFAFKSKRMRLHGAPLRDCGTLYEGEAEIDECCLFFPPHKLGNGRHRKTVMPKQRRQVQEEGAVPLRGAKCLSGELHS